LEDFPGRTTQHADWKLRKMLLNLPLEEKLMKRMRMLAVVALALSICLPGMAGAVTTFGDPFSTGSWSQRFQEDSVGNFNAIEAFMVEPAGTDFEFPGWSAFSNLVPCNIVIFV